MNGWATDIAIWEEASLLGAQAGIAYRPPGIVQVTVQSRTVQRWTTTGPLRSLQTEGALQQAWTITISRQFDAGAFSAFWLSSITDSFVTTAGDSVFRQLIDNPEPRSFGLEFMLEDGSQRRYSGLAVSKVEYTIASGRITTEEVTLEALRSDTFSGPVRPAASEIHSVHTGLMASLNLKAGTAWGSSRVLDHQQTFSSQLIFERDITPAQFDHEGRATRFSISGGWEFLGRIVSRSPALWTALHDTTACVAQWNLGTAANFLDIQANVHARLAGQTVLVNGQIDSNIDFQAYRHGRALFSLEIHSES